MHPTKDMIARLQASLHDVNAQDKLCVVAVVSGICEVRLRQIMDGAEPTPQEFSTLDMLRQS